MRKLVLILMAFIAAVTFIRAFDNGGKSGSNIAEQMQPLSGELIE